MSLVEAFVKEYPQKTLPLLSFVFRLYIAVVSSFSE